MNYPTFGESNVFPGNGSAGLTKREYFAAMAMQGMTSSCELWAQNEDKIAAWAVSQSDALIDALNGEKQP